MTRRREPDGRRRAVRAGAGALVLAAALAGGAAWTRRDALAAWWLHRWLASRGAEPAELRVARLGAQGIEVADVAIGPPAAPDLAVARIDARWSLRGLLAGRFDAVEISGARLRGVVGAAGVGFGAVDALLGGGPAADRAPALPAARITLRDARVELETPQGRVEGQVEGGVSEARDGAIAGDFALAASHPLGRVTGTLRVAGSAEAADFEGALAAADGRVRVEATGRADLRAGTGRAELHLAPIAFAPNGLQPAALSPALARAGITDVAGSIEARGHAERTAEGVAVALDVALRDLSLAHPLARVEGLHGAIELRAPPLHTPPGQLVSIARIDPGIPLTEGLIEFELEEGGALALRRAAWRLAGGELRAEDARLDPAAGRGELAFEASDLDLAALLERIEVAGLEGSGRIAGRLPLSLEGESLVVREGWLRATGAGTLRYRPDERTRALAASRPHDLGIAVAAFSDFHFEALEARVDGELQGAMKLGLHVRGANPSFQGGRPVELNLELEARLADLVRAGRASYRIPEVVEERLRAFSKGKTR